MKNRLVTLIASIAITAATLTTPVYADNYDKSEVRCGKNSLIMDQSAKKAEQARLEDHARQAQAMADADKKCTIDAFAMLRRLSFPVWMDGISIQTALAAALRELLDTKIKEMIESLLNNACRAAVNAMAGAERIVINATTGMIDTSVRTVTNRLTGAITTPYNNLARATNYAGGVTVFEPVYQQPFTNLTTPPPPLSPNDSYWKTLGTNILGARK